MIFTSVSRKLSQRLLLLKLTKPLLGCIPTPIRLQSYQFLPSKIAWTGGGEVGVLIVSIANSFTDSSFIFFAGCLEHQNNRKEKCEEEELASVAYDWMHLRCTPPLRKSFVAHIERIVKRVRFHLC